MSLIRSSSTTTAAPSTRSPPAPSTGPPAVQSTRKGLVKTVMLIARLSPVALTRHDLRFVHPSLLAAPRRPAARAGHAVEIVLLPQEDPGGLVVDELLELG